MSGQGKTFSESWHCIADQKISLRPAIRIQKQLFRGEKWYVLQDPFSNEFFRLSLEAYEFVTRLRPDRTVGQVWDDCLERDPDSTPGQEEVIKLLARLYFANLLYYELSSDSAKLFERYKRRKQKDLRSRLSNIMFIRIPIWDPDNLLEKIMPVIRLLLGPAGVLIWLTAVILAGKTVIEHFAEAAARVHGILAPDNLILLYACLVLIKALHELGHAMACKRFGGEVHTIGVMLMVFTPLPYMDATTSWSIRSRWQRAFVGAAGMIFEIFIASLAAVVWASTGPGTIHSISYNMMFIASVSTVLFNLNPLLRYDGYYILSDLLDIPNLHQRSLMHLRHVAERYVFGCRDSSSPASTYREALWLTVFGVLSGIYRVIVYAVIIIFVADRFLMIGLIMAMICVISWGVVPMFRFAAYLSSNPQLARTRARAVAVSSGCVAVVLLFLAVCPFPSRFRAPGILEADKYVRVVNEAPGYIQNILVQSGADVVSGTPLIILSNDELDLEISAAEAEHQEIMTLRTQAVNEASSDLESILSRLKTAEKKLQNLVEQRSALVVRARESGTWVSPRSNEMTGTWVKRGSEVGMIINNNGFRFSAVVSQSEASRLFAGDIRDAEVRFIGQADKKLDVSGYKFIPFQHDKLPSAALGWGAGGEVPVSPADESGHDAAEPFFQIYADLKQSPSVAFLHGRSGQIRFNLHPEPLLQQWVRRFRQLLQKRYQI